MTVEELYQRLLKNIVPVTVEETCQWLLNNCVSDCWRIVPTAVEQLSQQAWDVSERSQSDLHWERHLGDLLETSQKRWLFWDVFKTSQIHLKKDVFFMTSLTHLKNGIFCVTCLRHLGHISKNISFPWRLWDVPKTSLASIPGFSKIPHKNDFL